MVRPIALLVIALSLPTSGRAQEFDFYAHGPYRSEVPTPASILGYEPGEFHTDYGNMLRVIEAIAEPASDRVRMLEYGRSVEGRPLRALLVSAPANMQRLEEIRTAVARLRDPRATGAGEAARIAASTPAIAWMNYANDGDESAALETAMQVLYQLAAGQDSLTTSVLESVVTVITPAHNPESHERFVAWYNAFGKGDSAHTALEHETPWGMGTNNNHYQIDLNRDALGITQRETQALVALFHRWNPQVFVDHHGQTVQYYFPPPMLPINPSLPKEQVVKWTEIYGQSNAEAFDRYGWNYFVRDVFDLHYPGYWDSWPALNGAIGMTYETDGGGYKGYRWRRDDDTILTFRDGIAHHFTATMATLGATAKHREERLRDYSEFFRSGMNQFASARPWKRFVIVPGADPERAARLAETVLRHGIEVAVAERDFSSASAHDYVTGARTRAEFPAGSYVIDLAQPQARLADALLAPDAEIDPEFIQEQLQHRALNARRGRQEPEQRDEFYDITGWSLPISFGVEAYWLEEAPGMTATPLEVHFDEAGRGWRPPAFLGARDLGQLPEALARELEAGVRGGPAAVAYIFRYDRNASARLAIALLKEGYKVAVATKSISAGGTSYPRGSMVLRVSRNPDSLHGRIGALARRFGVPVDAVNTAYADEGDTGVGSAAVITLRYPRVAVLAGEGVGTRAYGHTWYTLEREFGLGFTALRVVDVTAARLANFDVLILPDGSARIYARQLGEAGEKALTDWVGAGGVVVGLEGGAEYLSREKLELTTARRLDARADEEGGDVPAASAEEDAAPAEEDLPPAHGARLPPLVSPTGGEGPLPVPGAIMRATLDLTHPLTFGYEPGQIPVLVSGSDFYSPSKEGSNPVVFVGGELRVAGFVWPENTATHLAGTAWMVDEPVKRGRVILMADDPNFRLIWPSLSRLFLNAILMGPLVGEAAAY